MAKFLTTKQISSALEELIQEADKTLYIVSPYLKLSKDFQELINSRNKNEKKTIIIYGKSDLTPEQLKFLTGLRHVYLKFHEHLHAKCYVNDTKLIITSLNFYEYSMIHNKEMVGDYNFLQLLPDHPTSLPYGASKLWPLKD